MNVVVGGMVGSFSAVYPNPSSIKRKRCLPVRDIVCGEGAKVILVSIGIAHTVTRNPSRIILDEGRLVVDEVGNQGHP